MLQNRGLGYLAAIFGIAAVTAICALLRSHINEMTVALAMLLMVLFIAAACGRWPGLVASVLGMLCLNYFFLPPLYTFTIADPKNWTALTAFFITALTAGQLSAWVKQRAAEAEASRSQARLASTYNRSLLEASLDPLMTIGHDGRIDDVNAAAETVTGRSRAELIGTDFSKYFREPGTARAAYEQVFSGGVVRGYALELRHRNGHSTSVLCDGSLYRDAGGNVIGVVAATRPIGTYAGKPPGARPDPMVLTHLRLFIGFATVFSVAVGLLSLVGLTFQIAILKSAIPGEPVIKFNAAVCLVLFGLSLWLLRQDDHRPFPGAGKLCGRLMAAITALVGVLSLTEYLTGWDLGIDQLLFREPAADAFFSARPGLIAPITALNFVLLGLALLLLDQGISWRSRRHWPAEYFASLTGILSIVGLLDFILGSHTSYTHIALQTAIVMLALSLGVLCARTERGLAALLASSTAGGVLVRRLLPAAVIIPIVIGALGWRAFSAGLYSGWSVVSLMIVLMITLLGGFAIWNGYIVNRNDVERLRDEGILHRREMELREAERLAQVGSWWWEPKTDRVTWSAGLSHIAGRDPMQPPPAYEEHLGFYTSQSSARLDEATQNAMQTGAHYELDLEMVRTDGAIRSVTGRGEVEHDADGQVVLVRGTVQDVTELKQAEAEVRGSEARHTATVQVSLDAIIAADARGCITEFNPAAEQMFGHRREDVLGREIADVIIPPSLRDRHRQGLAEYLATGVARALGRRVELTAIRASGEEFPVEIAIARIPSAGPAQFTAYIGDITARKRSEEALKKSAEEIRTLNAELEQRVIARTAELHAANKLKDELILRERAITTELAQAREREVEIGFKIQQTMLLDQPPGDVPGLRVAALTVPSQRIDGDFYIFIRHQNQCLDVIVGDVMGKGVPAALVGAATKTHFFKALSDLMALSKDGELPEPSEVVMLAHAGVARHLIELDSFVTLVYARLDVSRRRLVFVDCGHTGIALLHSGTGLCEVLHGDNLPMGVREGEIYDQIAVPFVPGDLFFLYSDGITEAHNPVRELFGMERLEECIRMNGHLEPLAFVEAIRKAVFTFSQSAGLSDDLTSVAIRVEEVQVPLARAEIDIQSDLGQLRRVREFVRAFCRDLPGPPMDEDSMDAVELAVNEAASNIMKHAYHGRADQWIHLEGEAFPGHVSMRLRHLGDPFDPAAAPPPALDDLRESGRGAYIIAQSVDEVRYYRDERGRNCVALVKKRKS